MVTLRHHVISLAAVFLALAIGVVLGSGVFSGTAASGLRGDKGDLRQQIATRLAILAGAQQGTKLAER